MSYQHQHSPDRTERVSLLFTEIDEAWETEWTPGKLESMSERTQSELLTRIG